MSNLKNLAPNVNYATPCYSLNNTYKIKMLFTDCNDPIDPTALEVSVTDPAGNNVVVNNHTKVEVGFYYLEYQLTAVGTWEFEWRATINNVVKTYIKKILVEDKVILEDIKFGLEFNELIVVDIFSGVKSSDGKKSLDEDMMFSFSTEYNPFYCSVEMLRMEMGSWVDLVPDDTMALGIHWASLEADSITSRGAVSDEYYYARTRFVMYDTAVKLFSMPVNPSRSGKSKQLGDLLIEEGSGVDYNLKNLIDELKEERDEWWRVVNARGSIVLGQGLGPTTATRNGLKKSREWHNPLHEHYAQPTQNSQYRRQGQGKYRHGFTGWNELTYNSLRNDNGGRK